MTAMREDPGAIIPEVLLLAGAIASLLVGLFLPRRRQWLVAILAAAVLLAAIVAAAVAACSATATPSTPCSAPAG
jgi:NADH-quinone oxidoreductase subunit N